MNPYFIGCFTLVILFFIIGLIWYANRAGRNAARVRSEQQNMAEANIQNAALSRMNQAASTAPLTDDELLEKLRTGKEGQ